jgi:hypothetical protein
MQMNSKISSDRKSTLENSKPDLHQKTSVPILFSRKNSKIETFMEQIMIKQDETLSKLNEAQQEIKTLRKNKS